MFYARSVLAPLCSFPCRKPASLWVGLLKRPYSVRKGPGLTVFFIAWPAGSVSCLLRWEIASCGKQAVRGPSSGPRTLPFPPLTGGFQQISDFVSFHSHLLNQTTFFFFLKEFLYFYYLFIYFGLCWVSVSAQGLSPVAASGGHSSSRCAGLSLSRPLLLRSTSSRCAGSVVVAHGPSCSLACGILPDQGSNPCPLH